MDSDTAKEKVRAALSHHRPRNESLVDVWSFVHIGTCLALTLLFGPLLAFIIALVWEPLEVLVLSPLLARIGIDFGHEHFWNSMSDIAFNTLGVGLGWALLQATGWAAPFAWI